MKNTNKLIISTLLCTFLFSGCANDARVKELEQQVADLEKQVNEQQEINTGEDNSAEVKTANDATNDKSSLVLVSTPRGNFEITVVGSSNIEWDCPEGTKLISIRCEINNLSYNAQGYIQGLNGFYLYENKDIKVLDEDGYSMEYFDIQGLSDGQYITDKDLAIGEKAKMGLLYFVGENTSKVTVVVGESNIELPI